MTINVKVHATALQTDVTKNIEQTTSLQWLAEEGHPPPDPGQSKGRGNNYYWRGKVGAVTVGTYSRIKERLAARTRQAHQCSAGPRNVSRVKRKEPMNISPNHLKQLLNCKHTLAWIYSSFHPFIDQNTFL